MQSLLMATDLSARSDRALERAVALAREFGARLTIVHVIDDDLPASLADAQETAANQTIRQHVREFAEDDGGSVSVEVVFGKTEVDILEMTDKTEAEMIVLGMHREDAFKDMFRGSTVERIVRAAPVPTLLVKDRVADPYRRIVVAVDFSVYSRRAVEFAVTFAPGAAFHLVHAYDVPFKGFLTGHDTRREISKQHQVQFEKMIGEEMATFLASLQPKAPELQRIMQTGLVREVIHRQVDKLHADLLVIGTHGRTGVAHAFLGSVAEDMLAAPPCDVLAVKAW